MERFFNGYYSNLLRNIRNGNSPFLTDIIYAPPGMAMETINKREKEFKKHLENKTKKHLENKAMKHTTYSVEFTEIVTNSNRTVALFTDRMLREGIITQEQYDEMEKYQIVVAKKGMFNRIYDYIFDDRKDKKESLSEGQSSDLALFVVKVIQ